MEERLQKVLARAGLCSRRKAEEYIAAGRVRVDGRLVTTPGVKVDPGRQRIEFDGRPLQAEEQKVYFLLNKPKGYVTTLHDPQKRPVVTALLRDVEQRVFPVGRLDVDTEGALLLTNDGAFAHRVLHPRFEINRTYRARLRGLPDRRKLDMLRHGIELEGRRTWPARIRVVSRSRSTCEVEIIIHEGRKRQVRKMFAAIGHPVFALKRIAYGGLELGDLRPGAYRPLTAHDFKQLFSGKK